MTPTTDLVVSVVAGSDPDLIRGFLRSICDLNQIGLSHEIVAIVNGFGQGDGDDLMCLGATRVLRRPEPRGFAANHNDVLQTYQARYYLIANDDVIVLPGTIRHLVEFMDDPRNARVGVVSPKLLNFDETLQPSTYSFPTLPRAIFGMTGIRDRLGTGRTAHWLARLAGTTDGQSRMWAHDRQVDVATLRGAFVLVRAECVAAVGPMVEIALVGGEETEWHRRMHDGGWRVVYLPEVAVLHKGHATVGGRPELAVEYLKGLIYYFDRHASARSSVLLRVAGVVIYGFRWLLAVARRDRVSRRVVGACCSALSRGV